MSILKLEMLWKEKQKFISGHLYQLPLQEKSVGVKNISKLNIYFKYVF